MFCVYCLDVPAGEGQLGCSFCGDMDRREKRGFWAPGRYLNGCAVCELAFKGDKRATCCAPCAYGDLSEETDTL